MSTSPSSYAQLPLATPESIEALYALLPSHIRQLDIERGAPLRALFSVFAAEGEAIDFHLDSLQSRLFVETAPENALADLAALVGAETLRPLPPGTGANARAFIANVLRYRRAKGTARMLEALANDVTALASVVVEYFTRLAQTQSMMNLRLDRPGHPSLRDPVLHSRIGTGFDRLPRLVHTRSIITGRGRHNIPNIGVHVLRPLAPEYRAPPGTHLPATAPEGQPSLAGVPKLHAWGTGVGYFQLSAQGEPTALFNPDRRVADGSDRMDEIALRDRLHRLPLHRETDALRRKAVGARAALLAPDLEHPWFNAEGQPFTLFIRSAASAGFRRISAPEILIANLAVKPASRPAANLTYPVPGQVNPVPYPIAAALDPITGRVIVAPRATGDEVQEVRLAHAYGIGAGYGPGPQERNADDVPFSVEKNDLIWIIETPLPTDPDTLEERVNAAFTAFANNGTGKRGFIVFATCDALPDAAMVELTLPSDSELHLVAAQFRIARKLPSSGTLPTRRGYLVRRERAFIFRPMLKIIAPSPPPGPKPRPGVLVLDGLEFAGGLRLGKNALSQLRLRYCSLRKPGECALAVLPSTTKLDDAQIRIEHSIVGQVRLGDSRGKLLISDSALTLDQVAGEVISAAAMDATIDRCTVLGQSRFKSLDATNTIFNDIVICIRRQKGCIRYSHVPPGPPAGPNSRTPRRFRCQPDLALAGAAKLKLTALTSAEVVATIRASQPAFIDLAPNEPTFAMLHVRAPLGIRTGGEGEVAMGVFSAEAEPLRLANLETLFASYLPFALEAGILDDTRSTVSASRRNIP
jgi:hypothetical protein